MQQTSPAYLRLSAFCDLFPTLKGFQAVQLWRPDVSADFTDKFHNYKTDIFKRKLNYWLRLVLTSLS